MRGPVQTSLAPVRRRQRWLLVLKAVVLGLLGGAAAGLALGLAKWFNVLPISTATGLAVVAAGPVLGVLVGLLWQRGWAAAAAAVDRHYELKDRAATALAFSARPDGTVFHHLQVEDAVQHLAGIEAPRVVPLRLPRLLPFAAIVAAAAVVVLAWPLPPPAVEAGPPEPQADILNEAQRIEEDLKEFEEMARQNGDKELQKLVQEIYQKVEEMKQPGVDQREALAKLSEMQAAIAAQQAQYNVGLVDGQLQALGTAMSSANALDGAGRALQEAKLEKAADELEKLEDPVIERKEAKTLEEKLKDVAKSMGEVGLGQLSDAVSELADGIKGGGKGKFQKATKVLAKEVRNQARRKKITDFLDAELARLGEGKDGLQGNNGGPRGKQPEKSLSPTSNWGRATSGNVIGEKTQMLSEHNLQQLTGNPGEGPSEVDTTHSAEGRQQAGRSYKEVYQKYRKMSDAVLDSEPIPLGHRQTIRRYFELIHPQNAEGDKPEKKDGQ